MSARILVVDHHDEIRRLFMVWLEGEEGLKVIGGARTAAEAVEALRREPADVVLLDLDMANGMGASAIQTVRDAFPDICIVGMSWDHSPERIARMLDAGACCLFDKADKLPGLVRAVRKCLE